MANHYHEAEAAFRRLLRTGKPVAFEDATRILQTPEGFDRRAFGHIPAGMAKAGEIVEAGYRRSEVSQAHCAPKRLWVLADRRRVG